MYMYHTTTLYMYTRCVCHTCIAVTSIMTERQGKTEYRKREIQRIERTQGEREREWGGVEVEGESERERE